MKKYLFIILFICFWGCSSSSEPEETQVQKKKIQNAISLSIETTKSEDMVIDAAITKEGRTFSLSIIVNESTNSILAKNLGENFIRQLKALIPNSIEPNPMNDIGSGNYNYIVGVYGNLTKEKICIGAKASSSRNIRW